MASGGAQVLCITHLPQIAAFANRHFCITKRVTGRGASRTTQTTVAALTGDDRVDELAEMLAGPPASAVSRAQAAELVASAKRGEQSDEDEGEGGMGVGAAAAKSAVKDGAAARCRGCGRRGGLGGGRREVRREVRREAASSSDSGGEEGTDHDHDHAKDRPCDENIEGGDRNESGEVSPAHEAVAGGGLGSMATSEPDRSVAGGAVPTSPHPPPE